VAVAAPVAAAVRPVALLVVAPPERAPVLIVHIIAGAGIIEAVIPAIIGAVAAVPAAMIAAAIIRIVIIVIIAAGAKADGETAIAIATVIGCAGAKAERGG